MDKSSNLMQYDTIQESKNELQLHISIAENEFQKQNTRQRKN